MKIKREDKLATIALTIAAMYVNYGIMVYLDHSHALGKWGLPLYVAFISMLLVNGIMEFFTGNSGIKFRVHVKNQTETKYRRSYGKTRKTILKPQPLKKKKKKK